MIKIIRDHPNYAVSDQGIVYRITKNGYKELKPDYSKGYAIVKLDRKNCYVQRLVAENFVQRYHDDQTAIVHVDNDVRNNKSDNLVWLSPRGCQKVKDWRIGYRKDYLKELAKLNNII